ncbi:penicillin-binding protein activator [Beijerinckia sp. L45]|uniref:penicillin-binding protein activator n=1 Tax=Beijerinckia sp. L45 TaxID=1641855 RepID=UPI00131BA893|nr:penicillin-binding protein activator [Beijerinckia sp. L45]
MRRSLVSPAVRLALLAGSTCLLAACGGGTVSNVGKLSSDSDVSANAPVGKVDSQPLPGAAAAGDTIGTGAVKVALILPLTSANGQPSLVGQSMRNAANLALSESGSTDLTILVKDDHSDPDGARNAAQAALGDGAELFIGPLFAPDVREAGKVARGAGKPMIAFSTDTSTASRGSYLLSFLIESYVDRIVDYAAAKGKKSIAALIPDNDYGRVADAEFEQEAAKKHMRVQSIEHYSPQTLQVSVKKVAALGDQIDSLFIPEQADAMPAMSEALLAAGLDGKRVQIMGTGLWNDARVLNLPALQGAWFAAPENGGFNSFAARYRAKYNADPTRIATLSYDAVSLAAALAKMQGSQRFSETVLLNKSGFNGADGVFRFRGDGLNDRGLAVLQINGGSAAPVSPAPRNFNGGSAT